MSVDAATDSKGNVEDWIEAFFEGKPETYKIFMAVFQQVQSLGSFEVSVRSQISFSGERQFAWFWLYKVTRKNPNGILHTTLRMDERVDDPHIRAITQISRNRWNHQVVIRTLKDANSAWMRRLLEAAYRFGSR
jgi:hypothetical protein